jgi:hypothetical protein
VRDGMFMVSIGLSCNDERVKGEDETRDVTAGPGSPTQLAAA